MSDDDAEFRFWLAVVSTGAAMGVGLYFLQLFRLAFVLPLE